MKFLFNWDPQRVGTFAVVLAFCGGLQAQSSSPYDGIPIPFDSMPTYPVYRQELLRKGWQSARLDSVTNSEEFQAYIPQVDRIFPICIRGGND